MTTHSLQSIREKIIETERQLDAFKRAEEALRELASLSLAEETFQPKASAARTNGANGITHKHGAPALIPTVLVKLGRPATVGMIRKNMFGRFSHRASKSSTWTALSNLTKEGAIKRVARGVYEKA